MRRCVQQSRTVRLDCLDKNYITEIIKNMEQRLANIINIIAALITITAIVSAAVFFYIKLGNRFFIAEENIKNTKNEINNIKQEYKNISSNIDFIKTYVDKKIEKDDEMDYKNSLKRLIEYANLLSRKMRDTAKTIEDIPCFNERDCAEKEMKEKSIVNNPERFLKSIESGDVHIAKLFIKSGIDVDTKNQNGESALMIASKRGHIHVVKLLIDNYANLDSKNNSGDSILGLVSINGNDNIVRLLIKNGADINIRNGANESTSLMYASEKGKLEVVKSLIYNGADCNITNDNLSYTAMKYAKEKRHFQIVEILSAHSCL